MQNNKIQQIHEQACVAISSALGKLTGKHAVVDIVKPHIKNVRELHLTFNSDDNGTAVCLPVSGEVKGMALLLLSAQTGFTLADLLIKKEPGTTRELDELDKSALQELGNIICGTYFTTFANQSFVKVIEHAPEIKFGRLGTLLEETVANFTRKTGRELALEVQFNFSIMADKNYCFESYFVVLFETLQLQAISDSLK